ncbi:MAG: hypothetical protein PHQ19_01285 [Candidatus Krumholzibacteria bacterium]|nr:hypothetical protein [Candidatus Krumholzibacteria bacterium]
MKPYTSSILIAAALAAATVHPAAAWDGGALRIEHTCSELGRIPAAWIDSTRADINVHFAHTSHGGQILDGLGHIAVHDAFYPMVYEYNALPQQVDALRIFDGQLAATYITPDLYWASPEGIDQTIAVLTANPEIDISFFVWCTQLDTWTAPEIGAYMDSISTLEARFPGVAFVYCTGNAQGTGEAGYNRWRRNEEIRAYCARNGKVLYDFADLDSWWWNPVAGAWEQATYEHEGFLVPVEHPQFNGDETSHTTWESCIQKGRAMWWLGAMLAGWYADPTGVRETSLGGLKRRFRAEP